MNTTAKGDKFEAQVFDLFSHLIDQRTFWAKKGCCTLRQKPKYYSRDREKPVIFDLSLEIRLEAKDDPFLIFLIECKDYGHAVPVDDVEEFHSKMQQVGAHKGIIAARSGFQKGAVTFAKNRSLGLMRCFDQLQHRWILKRSTAASAVFMLPEQNKLLEQVMIEESAAHDFLDAVFQSPASATTSVWTFFSDLTKDVKPSNANKVRTQPRLFQSTVPFIDRSSIEDVADRIAITSGTSRIPVDLVRICRREKEVSGLNVVYASDAKAAAANPTVLGRIIFHRRRIELFKQHSRNPHNLRFTLAHELGHYFLNHGAHMELDVYDSSDLEDLVPSALSVSDIFRLEVQANLFASSLLMPRREFLVATSSALKRYNIRNKGYGALYVDSQPANRISFSNVCHDLSRKFDVSFGAVATRLRQLGLLNDQTTQTPRRVLLEI